MKEISRLASYVHADDDDYITHHIQLDEYSFHFAMHGPYYISLLTTFEVNVGDTITFSWDEDDKIFNVFALS
jgi:hypothetical protein